MHGAGGSGFSAEIGNTDTRPRTYRVVEKVGGRQLLSSTNGNGRRRNGKPRPPADGLERVAWEKALWRLSRGVLGREHPEHPHPFQLLNRLPDWHASANDYVRWARPQIANMDPTELWPDGEKYCARCRKTKPMDEFDLNRSQRGGVSAQCTDCRRQQYRRRYANGNGKNGGA